MGDLSNSELKQIPVEQIRRGQFQPRRAFSRTKLLELANSIKRSGLIQPIIVRPVRPDGSGVRYEITAGERRWRAVQLAQMQQIPAIVREQNDEQTAAAAMIENIQREDLNPVEVADGLKALQDEANLDQKELASIVGWERSRVTHYLRILRLPDDVQELLEDGRLLAGHARVIASLPATQARRLAHEADKRNWSVRQLEAQVKALRQKTVVADSRPDSDVARLERKIGEHLGAPCSLVAKKTGAGRLIINYHSLDELSGIIEKIGLKTE